MEPPAKFKSKYIHDEKVKVFSAIRKYHSTDIDKNCIRAQYEKGTIQEKDVVSYQNEPGVDIKSQTETYACLRLFIDNWRWAGVPIYLRSGKRLKSKKTEIVVALKNLPESLFDNTNIKDVEHNKIIIRIQPEEGISLCMNSKRPGHDLTLDNVEMDFSYSKSFADKTISDAYERLLYDAVEGDSTLFNRSDEIEESWKFIDPILKHWQYNNHKFQASSLLKYNSGTQGPKEATNLIHKDGFEWKKI
jgi:glucose-6-phosphate 1-dehydrogenase